MWETWVQSLGHEDPLEKGMATHSSILAWRIPWTEEPGGLQAWDCNEFDMTEQQIYTVSFQDILANLYSAKHHMLRSSVRAPQPMPKDPCVPSDPWGTPLLFLLCLSCLFSTEATEVAKVHEMDPC